VTNLSEKQQAVARMRRAHELLEDEVLAEAFRRADERFVEEWRASDAEDNQKRLAAWAKAHALEAVKAELRRIINTGEHAQAVLQKLQ